MKDLAATATALTSAAPADAFALLSDLEGYPRWYPEHVPSAQWLEPALAKLTLRGSIGPIGGEFRIHVSIASDPPERIELRRLPKDPRDPEEMSVVWQLSATPEGGTKIEVTLRARLSIPALVPVGPVPDRFAREFVSAAARELDSRSPA